MRGEIQELNQVLKLRKTKATPHNGDVRPYVALEHIESGSTRLGEIGIANEATSSKSLFYENDILFGRLRPYLKKCTLAEVDVLCVTDILVLVSRGGDPRYLCHLMHSDRIMSYASRCSIGTKMPRISWEALGELAVPVHRPIEQERIAALLDSIDTAIGKTSGIAKRSDRSKQALMQALCLKPKATSKEFHLGELFDERKESGLVGLPTLSVTRYQGLVTRDSLGRKVDSELTPRQHLLVRQGDIAYNMMRMWQGVSGYASCDGLVSPAYVVLRPTALIDSLYASFLFKVPEIVRLFHRFSQGLTDDRLRLYYDQFRDIKVTIPVSLDEQKRVAELLIACDTQFQVMQDRAKQLERLKTSLSQGIFN